MSWMDDGGFEMQTFTAWDGRPMARMSFRTSTGPTYFTLTKTEVQRIRRIKTLLAIIACTASATLLFTWRTADSQTATILVSVIYLLTGLWLTVRFAPRD